MLHLNWLILVICLFKTAQSVTQLFPVHTHNNNNNNGSGYSRYQLNHKFSDNSFNDYGPMDQEDVISPNYGYNNHNNNRGGKAYANPGLNSNALNSHDSSSPWTSNEDGVGGQSSTSLVNSPLDTGASSGGRDSYSSGDLATAADGHILGYGHLGGHGWNNFGHNHHHHHGHVGWYPPKTYHYQIYPVKSHIHHGHHHHLGWGWGYDQGWSEYGHELWDKFSGWIGLKGVNITSFIKSVLIAIPIIVGILVFLFFLPIPVFLQPNPFCGRTTNKLWQETARLTKNILDSEECVERISCEIQSLAHKYNKSQWIPLILKNIPSNMKSKLMDRLLTTTTTTEGKKMKNVEKCSKYSCNPLSHVKKSLKLE